MIHRFIASKENLYKWQIVNNNLCNSCGQVDSTFHFMLYCKDVTMFWKIICNLIFNLFQIEIQIDQKIIVVGKDIGNKKYSLLNIILNYAQYAIYKCYVKKIVNGSVYYPHTLFFEFKSLLRLFLRYECVSKENNTKLEELLNVL